MNEYVDKITLPYDRVFFTADHHFGHENIIEFCSRPFYNELDMADELVARWNDRVKPGDIVYYLGDFAFGTLEFAIEMFSLLQGDIRLLTYVWHHDGTWLRELRDMDRDGWGAFCGIRFLPPVYILTLPERINPDKGCSDTIMLSHYPFASWEKSYHGSYHLHGHSHCGISPTPMSRLDVGVDCWDWAPVSLDTIVKHFKDLIGMGGM